MISGYVYRDEWRQLVSGNAITGRFEDRHFIRWDSAAETVEEVMNYVAEWCEVDDNYGGSVCRFEATLEPVATVVKIDEPEPEVVPSGELF